MDRRFERTELLFGTQRMEQLTRAKVLVVGAGGVGGFACEGLARCGIGTITVVDFDKIDITNINRQIIALTDTIGRNKADVLCERIFAINPNCVTKAINAFFSSENSHEILADGYDYIVDAIDIVTSKLHLIEQAKLREIPILSALGTGNKSDPAQFRIADISKTSVCPLARVIRYELKQRGIIHTKVLFSTETPVKISQETGKMVASNSFTPSIAGLLIAREVVMDLMQ